MSVVDTFLDLADYFTAETITLRAGYCLNTRFRQVGCTLCEAACPAEEAIVLKDGKPALNTDACLQCGLCLHVCPTGAYSRPDPMLKRLSKTVAALPPDTVVELLCPQNPTPEAGFSAAAVQTKRCLAALSPADMLELAAQGRPVRLDDRFCADCPLGATHDWLVRALAQATAWAALLPDAGPLSLHTAAPPDAPARPRPVFDVDRPPVSRRGFFGMLKTAGQESLGVALADEPVDPSRLGRTVPVAERMPHFVPAQRARVLNLFDQSAVTSPPEAEPAPDLPTAEVIVDPDLCSACGLCARFCPTGAISFVKDDEQFGLPFYSALCLGADCHICLPACPEKAVNLQPATPSAELVGKKPRYLAVGDLTSCEKCGTPIAAGPEHPTTCFACRPRDFGQLI